MGNILGAPESLLPVRRVGGGRPPVSPYTPGVSGCSPLRDKETQPPLSDWFPGTTSRGWTHHSTQNTAPSQTEPQQLPRAPPQKGPRGLRGADGTQAGRQGKGGGQGTSGNGWRGSLGRPGPEGGMCGSSCCFPRTRRLQPDRTDFPLPFSPSLSFPLLPPSFHSPLPGLRAAA